LFDQTRQINGLQPNSAAQADGASIGGSYIFHGGFVGAARLASAVRELQAAPLDARALRQFGFATEDLL
jgi:hypothetical protein